MYKVCIVISALCIMSFTGDRTSYPQDYFDLPVSRDIKLSGTFGELRSNHFHAGIDIKTTDGRPGEDIFAAARGHISRIKVGPSGYGRALYIAHPNGFTTVYAHLDRFNDELEEYVRDRQYALRKFSVDLYPESGAFPVIKGAHIGYLGNSGSSFGPHLHFEIRRSAGQVPINPLLFGLRIDDRVSPSLHRLKVYYLNADLECITVEDHPLVYLGDGQYRLQDTLAEGAWRVGFAVKADDRMNGAPNRNGIYTLQMSIDGEPAFAFDMEDIPFSVTRYLNAHIDYRARSNGEGYYHRCFKLPGNALGIYDPELSNGVIDLFAGKTQHIEIVATDISGNSSALKFDIRRDTAMLPPPANHFTYPVAYDAPYAIHTEDFSAEFEAGTFYENTYLLLESEESEGERSYAPLHTISPDDIPLHKYVRITLRHHDLPDRLQSKAFLALRDDDGKFINCGGTVNGEYITGGIRALGTFTVLVDTIPPKIRPLRFSPQMTGARMMQFRITDDQEVTGRADGLRYEATVDGQWILMEYDRKRDVITHYFDGRIETGKHTLRLVVTDDRGNTSVFEGDFTL